MSKLLLKTAINQQSEAISLECGKIEKILKTVQPLFETCAVNIGSRYMTKAIIVDTDILIDLARGEEMSRECLEKLETQSMLEISVITKMELFVGCRNKKEQKEVQVFLNSFPIHDLTPEISNKCCELLNEYSLSHHLLIPDALIAATAISYQKPLISKNQKDFRFIDGLDLLPYPW